MSPRPAPNHPGTPAQLYSAPRSPSEIPTGRWNSPQPPTLPLPCARCRSPSAARKSPNSPFPCTPKRILLRVSVTLRPPRRKLPSHHAVAHPCPIDGPPRHPSTSGPYAELIADQTCPTYVLSFVGEDVNDLSRRRTCLDFPFDWAVQLPLRLLSPRHGRAPLRAGPDIFTPGVVRSDQTAALRVLLQRDAVFAEDHYRYPTAPRTNDFPRLDRPGSRPAG